MDFHQSPNQFNSYENSWHRFFYLLVFQITIEMSHSKIKHFVFQHVQKKWNVTRKNSNLTKEKNAIQHIQLRFFRTTLNPTNHYNNTSSILSYSRRWVTLLFKTWWDWKNNDMRIWTVSWFAIENSTILLKFEGLLQERTR